MTKEKTGGRGQLLHAAKTLLLSGVAYVVNYGILLVLTPFITRNIGAEAYGFVTLAKEFSQYAAILTMALNTYAARYIGLAYHKNDIHGANVYFASVFWGNVVLSTLILGGILVFIRFMDSILVVSPELLHDVRLLFFYTFVSFGVTTVFSVFGCAGYISNRMDLVGLFKTASYVVKALVLVAAYALFPPRAYYVALGILAAALLVGAADFGICRKFLPEMSVSRRYFSFGAVKELLLNGFWASFNMVGEILNNGLDLLICNQMLTNLEMGQLAIAKTMQTIMQGVYYIVNQTFIPRFLKSYASDAPGMVIRELKLAMKVSGMLANVVFAGFVAFGLTFYKLWIPEQDSQVIYLLTVITFLTSIASGPMQPLYYIYTLTLKQKLPCIITIIGGLLNVAGMFILIKYAGMGVYAVAWTTVAVMFVINFVTNPLYMARCLHVPSGTFYPDILRNALSCGVLTLLFRAFAGITAPEGWLTLILCAAACAAVGAPLHLLIVCNGEQRQGLLALIRRK